MDVSHGEIVGGRYTSQRGSRAKRLITSSAAAAFSSRTVILPRSRVATIRFPSTSSMSRKFPSRAGAGQGGSFRLVGINERFRRLVIDSGRWDRHQLILRVPEGGQLTPKDTAGIDIDSTVEPGRLHHRGVAIDHRGPPPIAGGPVGTHRETPLVRFPRGLAVEAEIPDPGGSTTPGIPLSYPRGPLPVPRRQGHSG